MTQNHWIITEDFVENGEAVGVASIGFDDAGHPELPVLFQMYDGDDNLCYEGQMVTAEFDPLDDFGQPNAGCTKLLFDEGDGWQEL